MRYSVRRTRDRWAIWDHLKGHWASSKAWLLESEAEKGAEKMNKTYSVQKGMCEEAVKWTTARLKTRYVWSVLEEHPELWRAMEFTLRKHGWGDLADEVERKHYEA